MALPAALDEQLTLALAAEAAKVERDERLAFDGPSRSSARAGRNLLGVHQARAERVRSSGDVAAFEALYRDIADEVRLPSVIVSEADRRTLLGAAQEVGAGIARDAGQLAADTGRGWMTVLRLSPLILVALAALAVWVFAHRAGRSLPETLT